MGAENLKEFCADKKPNGYYAGWESVKKAEIPPVKTLVDNFRPDQLLLQLHPLPPKSRSQVQLSARHEV